MKQLFDPSKPYLAVWLWIRDVKPYVHPWARDRRDERPFPLPQTPLHYAALWDLQLIVEFLIIERPQDVRS